MTQLIDGGAGDVMIFDERIGGFSRAAQVETERLSACLKTVFDKRPRTLLNRIYPFGEARGAYEHI